MLKCNPKIWAIVIVICLIVQFLMPYVDMLFEKQDGEMTNRSEIAENEHVVEANTRTDYNYDILSVLQIGFTAAIFVAFAAVVTIKLTSIWSC